MQDVHGGVVKDLDRAITSGDEQVFWWVSIGKCSLIGLYFLLVSGKDYG